MGVLYFQENFRISSFLEQKKYKKEQNLLRFFYFYNSYTNLSKVIFQSFNFIKQFFQIFYLILTKRTKIIIFHLLIYLQKWSIKFFIGYFKKLI